MTEIQNSRIEILNSLLAERLEYLLKALNIDFTDRVTYYVGTCPCHNSDNWNSCSILKERGFWKCYTNGCGEKFGFGLIGLIRGVNEFRTGKYYPFKSAVNWAESFLGNPKLTTYNNGLAYIKPKSVIYNMICPKETVSYLLDIPSPYYLDGGLSKNKFKNETLIKFCVGDCRNYKKKMGGRVVFPVFSECGSLVIGAAGRVIYEKEYLQKWLYNDGFKAGEYFYGWNEALDEISSTKQVVIVEGMGDVLRLYEAGIAALGLFGCSLSVSQLKMLNRIGISNLIIMMDGDIPGRKAASRIYDMTSAYFNVNVITLPENVDPADLSSTELRTYIKEI